MRRNFLGIVGLLLFLLAMAGMAWLVEARPAQVLRQQNRAPSVLPSSVFSEGTLTLSAGPGPTWILTCHGGENHTPLKECKIEEGHSLDEAVNLMVKEQERLQGEYAKMSRRYFACKGIGIRQKEGFVQ
jgi:hypothetical protein